MGHDKIADTQVFKQPRSNWFCPSLRAQAKQSMASTAAAFSPRPACGERSRASCERVRGTLDRLALADSPPHPETLLRAVSDLSPQAGEVLMLVIASGAKQSMARHRQIEDGLLRSARNDGGANCSHPPLF